MTISSPAWARFWTSVPPESVTIPQLFARHGTLPTFTLLGISATSEQIRRVYRLEADGVECECQEVFADRDMFSLGPAWDAEGLAPQVAVSTPRIPEALSRVGSSYSLRSVGSSESLLFSAQVYAALHPSRCLMLTLLAPPSPASAL